jgi:hypothetical protein
MEKSMSVSACSAKKCKGKLVVSPYFPQHLKLSHGSGIFINPQESNKKLRFPKLERKAKPTVTAEEKVVSCYLRKTTMMKVKVV